MESFSRRNTVVCAFFFSLCLSFLSSRVRLRTVEMIGGCCIWHESSDLKHSAGNFLAREVYNLSSQKMWVLLPNWKKFINNFKSSPVRSLWSLNSAQGLLLSLRKGRPSSTLSRSSACGGYDSVISEGKGAVATAFVWPLGQDKESALLLPHL